MCSPIISLFTFLEKPECTNMFSYKEESLTSSSVTLIWNRGFNGGLPQTFVIQYRKVSENQWSNATVQESKSTNMVYTVTGLSSNEDYVATLFAHNEIGQSCIYGVVTFHTLSSKGKIILMANETGLIRNL